MSKRDFPVPSVATDGALCCPKCGSSQSSLHHAAVRVFERVSGEDGDGVCVTVQAVSDIVVKPVSHAQMPGRRQCVQIDFACEQCGGLGATVATLQIMQHKGATIVQWVDQSNLCR